MHVLTPGVVEILGQAVSKSNAEIIQLSPALSELARREKYLAHQLDGVRYDIDIKYGLLIAQLALGLSGEDRDQILTNCG